MLKESRKFAMRGNAVDHLAVGVIIRAAFGKIITSLVNSVPPVRAAIAAE